MSVIQIERGLQSNKIEDNLAAIAQCAKAIHDNPFPNSVNSILLRLVSIFQVDDTKADHSRNLIRLRIVKLVKECNLDLFSVSDDPIVRCIMKVSHSNDYRARSLAMLFLAAVAPIVHQNKKLHYLLIESLECEDSTELMSTIIAVGAIGRYSSDFSAIVVKKIGNMLLNNDVDISIKVRLEEDLALFQQNLEVTSYCMELGKQLLQSNTEHRFSVAIICALTEMAKRNGLGLCEHITLILDEIAKINDNEVLLTCCLKNLLDLVYLPHHWNSSQVLRLFDYQGNVSSYESNKPLIFWLQALNHLIKHTHVATLSLNTLFERLLPLEKNNNFTVKIYLLELFYSRLENASELECGVLLNNLLNDITSELAKRDSEISLDERVKFYKLMANHIRNGSANRLNISANSFAEFLMGIDGSYPEHVFLKSLETLNFLCETNQEIGRAVCSRAIKMLWQNYGKSGRYLDAPLELYSLAFQPLHIYSTQLQKITTSIQTELIEKKNWWFAFKLARLGFRYGHWADISLPLLEQIQENCDTIEISSFITALIYIAKAQLPRPFDITVLNTARHSLQHASLILTPLVQSSRNSQSFAFASDYIECLYSLFGAFSLVLISLNTNKNFDIGPKTTQHMKYTKLSMDKAKTSFAEARKKWIALQSRSFDADEHTQQHLELYARYCQLFESILTRIFASDFVELAPMTSHATSTTNLLLEQLIGWGIVEANQSIHAVTGALNQRASVWKNNFDRFAEIFGYLSSIPLCLPRNFFQQIYQTKIKLNVTPQPKERGQTLTISSKQLALSVEGVIETNNIKPIQKITVFVHVYYGDKSNEPQIVDSRTYELHENYFFKVNFLLNIVKSAEIVTSLTFMDSIEKRTWRSNALNKFQVTALDSH
ncbi:Integrator complex subunit 7 [Aphelenchoides bicaudatus]|nr:Integrator complex subunit 7 [Aphelenchoides bicaudatus]